MEYLVPSLAALSTGSPIYLALLVGIVLAMVKWRDHTQVSALALAGLGILLVTFVVGVLLSMWMPMHLADSGMTPPEVSVWIAIVALVRGMIEGVGFALVVAAIFVRRKRA